MSFDRTVFLPLGPDAVFELITQPNRVDEFTGAEAQRPTVRNDASPKTIPFSLATRSLQHRNL